MVQLCCGGELFIKLQGRALTRRSRLRISTSLEFFSAPHNSLLARYKPEALAAIRCAFDVFQGEITSLPRGSFTEDDILHTEDDILHVGRRHIARGEKLNRDPLWSEPPELDKLHAAKQRNLQKSVPVS